MWCKFKYYFCFHCTNCLRPTLRRFHLSEMKRISGFHYFLYMFTNLTSQHVLVTTLSLFYEGKLVCSVLRRVDLGRICSSIAQDLKLDWLTQITWKHEASGNIANICWCTATPKLTNISDVLLISLGQVVYFHKID